MIKEYQIVSSPEPQWFGTAVHEATLAFQKEGLTVEVQFSTAVGVQNRTQYSALLIARQV